MGLRDLKNIYGHQVWHHWESEILPNIYVIWVWSLRIW